MVDESEAVDSPSTAITLDAGNEGEQVLYCAHHRVAKETRINRWPVAARNEREKLFSVQCCCRLLGKMPANKTKRQCGSLQLQLKHSMWQRKLQRKQLSSRLNRYSVLCMSRVSSAWLLRLQDLKEDKEATLLAAAAEEEKAVRPQKLHREKLKNRANRYSVLCRLSRSFAFFHSLFASRHQGIYRVSYAMSWLPCHCPLILHLVSSAGC